MEVSVGGGGRQAVVTGELGQSGAIKEPGSYQGPYACPDLASTPTAAPASWSQSATTRYWERLTGRLRRGRGDAGAHAVSFIDAGPIAPAEVARHHRQPTRRSISTPPESWTSPSAAQGTSLNGATLGILGLGRLGTRVAEIASAFGMDTIAWSQHLKPDDAQAKGVTCVARDALFSRSDILSIHVVLSERTRGLVGERELRLMKPTAILVNTSRGPVVDEAALLRALDEKSIAAAALDV
ncbi:NAD(P)-dependent oxidoreductase [Streptomyces sp. NPDC052023]|uniref:NAD(P)-dependent oxidoreductase n=1 Tax=Streptomyces sp. NPDC052023 TaxID=3365681 RepID=UPI0037D4EE65